MPELRDEKALADLLREHGFKGSAPTFRRFLGKDFVAVVHLQASAGEFHVNLGAHYRWLGKPSSWERIKEYECAFRTRLEDFAANERFSWKDAASVTALLEMMKLEGLVFFTQLAPDEIATTAKGLARDGYDKFVPLGAPADAATWARVAAHFGDAVSRKRLEAQEAAAIRARGEERARERTKDDAEVVEMTYAEYRAAQKDGHGPKVVRLANRKSRAKR
jgi:hypothetical protein